MRKIGMSSNELAVYNRDKEYLSSVRDSLQARLVSKYAYKYKEWDLLVDMTRRGSQFMKDDIPQEVKIRMDSVKEEMRELEERISERIANSNLNDDHIRYYSHYRSLSPFLKQAIREADINTIETIMNYDTFSCERVACIAVMMQRLDVLDYFHIDNNTVSLILVTVIEIGEHDIVRFILNNFVIDITEDHLMVVEDDSMLELLIDYSTESISRSIIP